MRWRAMRAPCLKGFGYAAKPVDTAYGLSYADRYLEYLKQPSGRRGGALEKSGRWDAAADSLLVSREPRTS